MAGRSGLEAVNARAVASTAGLSHGLVYFYFDTKEGLLRGLLDRVMADVLDGPSPGFGDELPAEEAFGAMLKFELEDLMRQRELLSLLFQFYFLRHDDLYRTPINEGMREYEQRLASVIERIADPVGLSSGTLRAFAMAVIQGAVIDVIRRPEEFEPGRLLDAMRAVTSRGVSSGASPG